MDHGSKLQKIPKSAISLYVQLYCKKKNNTATKYCNNVEEATKSWLSLTKEEKHKFFEKFENSRLMYQRRFADYLKNAKPYLKKKHCKGVTNVQEEVREQESQVSADVQEHDTRKSDDHLVDNLMDTENPYQEIFPENYSETLAEPVPPNVKNAEDLFNVVTAMEGNNKKHWKALTQIQKMRYRSVVYKLKGDYIAKYRAYLEVLPSKQLFEYYHKTINS